MTPEQMSEQCKPFAGVTYRVKDRMYYACISITVYNKPNFIHLGHYKSFEHAKQARAKAEETKKEVGRKNIRVKHIKDDIERFREYLNLPPIRKINK
jgi:hypothetical protein